MIKLKFNFQDSGKVKKFFRLYYEFGHGAKGMHAKITMEKDVNKLVYGYEKFTGSDLEVEKPHVAPDTDLSKSDIE